MELIVSLLHAARALAQLVKVQFLRFVPCASLKCNNPLNIALVMQGN